MHDEIHWCVRNFLPILVTLAHVLICQKTPQLDHFWHLSRRSQNQRKATPGHLNCVVCIIPGLGMSIQVEFEISSCVLKMNCKLSNHSMKYHFHGWLVIGLVCLYSSLVYQCICSWSKREISIARSFELNNHQVAHFSFAVLKIKVIYWYNNF